MKLLHLLPLLFVSLLPLLSQGCKENPSPVHDGIKNKHLIVGNGTEPQVLDPQLASGLPEIKIISTLFEGLTTLDPQSLTPVPALCQKWDISPDGTTYTFHIRDKARWSNGDPITAYDFIFSYQRILSPKFASPYASQLFYILNAKEFYEGKLSFNDVGVAALSPKTLQIKLTTPIPYFPTLLSHTAWFPVHADTILKLGSIDQLNNPWTLPKNIVCSGPFLLQDWKLSEHIIVDRNPFYWDKDSVRLNQITFLPLSTEMEELAFRREQIHITDSILHTIIKSYKDTNSPLLHIDPFFSTYAYVFNTQKPPFNNPLIRKAFSLSIDRFAIVEKIRQRGETPAFSFVPPSSQGYNSSFQLHENIHEAQRLLADAGFPDGQGLPPIQIVYNSAESHKSIAEALQQMWAQNLKAHVELVNQEWKVYLNTRKTGDFNLIRFGWVGDYYDPFAFLEVLSSYSTNNFSGWKNLDYDKLLSQALQSPDNLTRLALMDNAESLLLQDLPLLPIFFLKTARLIHPSVKNWHPNPLDIPYFKYVDLQP